MMRFVNDWISRSFFLQRRIARPILHQGALCPNLDWAARHYPSFPVVEVTVADQERAFKLARVTASGLDKACQANFKVTVHIDPQTSKEEIARFAKFI